MGAAGQRGSGREGRARGGNDMRLARRMAGLAFAALAGLGLAMPAEAQEKKVKIGVIYD